MRLPSGEGTAMSAPVGRRPGTGTPSLWNLTPPRDDGHPPGVRLRVPVLVLASEETGSAQRTPGGSGWDSLTPRELEVVALVTRGATNQQTARRLSLSPHTVNAHLRHVFTKLGISSRVELTRVALTRERDVPPRRLTGPLPDRSRTAGSRTPPGGRRGLAPR